MNKQQWIDQTKALIKAGMRVSQLPDNDDGFRPTSAQIDAYVNLLSVAAWHNVGGFSTSEEAAQAVLESIHDVSASAV